MLETREDKKSMTKSNCHHAPMDVAGEGTTHFYLCRKCGQPCNPIKIEPVPDEVVELVHFTANEISKAKGHAVTVKEPEVRLILETVKMIYSIQKGRKK